MVVLYLGQKGLIYGRYLQFRILKWPLKISQPYAMSSTVHLGLSKNEGYLKLAINHGYVGVYASLFL